MPAGDRVQAGQPLLALHTDTPERIEWAREALAGAYTIGDSPPEPVPLVLGRVD